MNRNIIITGANRGIGKAMVKAFAENGDNIWCFIRTDSKEFTEYCDNLANTNKVWIKKISINLTSSQSIKEAFREIKSEKKTLDIIINCAGIGHLDLFQMTSMEKIREIYEVNLFAVMQLCQYAIRIMSHQGYGKIINIASTAAKEVYVGNSVYGASKAAVVAFTQSLAAEVAKMGIQANAIAPGLTDTDMSAVFEGKNPDLPLPRSAIGRKLHPYEVADVAVALSTDSMKIINGQMICVNGGAK